MQTDINCYILMLIKFPDSYLLSPFLKMKIAIKNVIMANPIIRPREKILKFLKISTGNVAIKNAGIIVRVIIFRTPKKAVCG